MKDEKRQLISRRDFLKAGVLSGGVATTAAAALSSRRIR